MAHAVDRLVVVAQSLAAAVVVARFARGRRRRPPLAAGAPRPGGSISIVIPARDEAARIGPCLEALRDVDAEVLVVDDRSTDATADLARSLGAIVIEGAELPPEWTGKAWALQQGLEAASGAWVVFLDADTRPKDGLVPALIEAAAEFDLLSAGPRFVCDGAGERLLHPAMAATLPYRFGPADAAGWQPSPRRAICNGQCVVVRREPFRAAGGWGRVHANLSEDIALARSLRAAGWRVGFADAADLLDVRMYDSARETWTGWGRSLMGSGATDPLRQAGDVAVIWLTMAPYTCTGKPAQLVEEVGLSAFSISDVVDQTGVAEGTLRMWERRHGFPTPERLPSGHRRYSARDVELVRQVAADRAAGVSLAVAIERAARLPEPPEASLFAALRRRRPDLEPRTLPKRLMLALSHAIEEESLSRAERPLLFASFQREHFYREEEQRWREFSRTADLTVAFADFERVRTPRGGPVEVPVDRNHPLAREWAIVCDAEGHGICLAGWEPTSSSIAPAGERFFETIWSVEPDVVREAARICAAIAATRDPALVDSARARLDASAALTTDSQLRLSTAITNRTLSFLGGAGRSM